MVPIERLTGSFTGMPVAYGGNAPLTTAGNPAPRCIFLTNLKTMLRSEAHHLIIPPHPLTTVKEMTTLGGVNGTICDAQQYQQSLLSLTSVNPSISCLTHGQTIGLAVRTQFL